MEESNIETHNAIKLSPRFTLHPAKTRRNGSHADFRFLILIFGELAPIPRCPYDYRKRILPLKLWEYPLSVLFVNNNG